MCSVAGYLRPIKYLHRGNWKGKHNDGMESYVKTVLHTFILHGNICTDHCYTSPQRADGTRRLHVDSAYTLSIPRGEIAGGYMLLTLSGVQ